jgi:hypothetical protein
MRFTLSEYKKIWLLISSLLIAVVPLDAQQFSAKRLFSAGVGFTFGTRTYSVDGEFFIERRYALGPQKVIVPTHKGMNESFALYRNTMRPEKVWEKSLSKVRDVVIAKNAYRTIFFVDDYHQGSACPYNGQMIILNEKGKVIAEYDHEQIGFDMGCYQNTHGQQPDRILSGSLEFSLAENSFTLGSLKINHNYIHLLSKLREEFRCEDFWDCHDKGAIEPKRYLQDQVWQFDLEAGVLLAHKKIGDPENTIPFPVTARQPQELMYEKYERWSENEQYKLQMDSYGNIYFFRGGNDSQTIWKSRIGDYTSRPSDAFVSNDGKRVVITLTPLKRSISRPSPVMIFLNEKGKIIKSYHLSELISSPEYKTSKGYIVLGRLESEDFKPAVGLVTRIKRTDVTQDIYEPGNLLERPILRIPSAKDHELLLFDLITGKVLSREAIKD